MAKQNKEEWVFVVQKKVNGRIKESEQLSEEQFLKYFTEAEVESARVSIQNRLFFSWKSLVAPEKFITITTKAALAIFGEHFVEKLKTHVIVSTLEEELLKKCKKNCKK